MTASSRDREYMQRIGKAKAASHDEAAARHRALPVGERLRWSLALSLTRRDPSHRTEREDDPSPFFERARRLGLYRP